MLKYFEWTLVPMGLTIDHFLSPQMLSVASQVVAWMIVILATLFTLRVRWRWLTVGWWFFILCLAPTSSFFPTVDLLVERRAYLAAGGVYLSLAGLAVAVGFRYGNRFWVAPLVLLFALNIAVASTRVEVFSSAESLWREALQISPANPRARLNLATALTRSRHYDDAKKILEGLLVDQPLNALVYSKLAFIYQQKDYPAHDEQKALELYQRSFALDSNDVIALLNAASLWVARQNYAEAQALIQHAIALNPKMAYAHFAAGEVAWLQNKPEEAEQQFRLTLLLDPGFIQASEYLKRMGH